MENATKALLIAGAVLILVMVLSLVVIFWDQVTSYFSAGHDAKMQAQLVEFNNKFQNYAGKTIRGNELVSIMNRIVDYNDYQSDIVGYERIKITINFSGQKDDLRYNTERREEILVEYDTITNNANDDRIEKIATTSSRLVEASSSSIPKLTDVKLQKMSAGIDTIFDGDIDDDHREARAKFLTKVLGYEIAIKDDPRMDEIKNATSQYYQFTMFKRAVFECTDVNYDEANGRVSGMEFKVKTETDSTGTHIKFD